MIISIKHQKNGTLIIKIGPEIRKLCNVCNRNPTVAIQGCYDITNVHACGPNRGRKSVRHFSSATNMCMHGRIRLKNRIRHLPSLGRFLSQTSSTMNWKSPLKIILWCDARDATHVTRRKWRDARDANDATHVTQMMRRMWRDANDATQVTKQ